VRIAIADAAEHLEDLVRRAKAGEEVTLTRGGRAIARLEPVASPEGRPAFDPNARRGTLAEFLSASPLRGADIDLNRVKDR
jgi:prevent-host-death family protein